MTVAGPLVSVVIPAYQAEGWVRVALESVAGQLPRRGELEVIVVDDGSEDGTAETARRAIDELGLDGTVVRLPRNEGVSAARNTGWRAARGPWVQFLDADDVLAPAKLTTQLAVAADTDATCAVVYSPWQSLDQVDGTWAPRGDVVRSAIEDPIRDILGDVAFGYVGPCLVRRAAVAAVEGFDATKSLGEDLDLMLRLAVAGWGFRKADSAVPLFFYRSTPNSLWRRAAASDTAALAGRMRTVADAEGYLRRATGRRPARRTRLALAWHYVATYQSARLLDPRLAREARSRAAALHLHGAPANAPRSARLLAPLVGLGAALGLHERLRTLVPPRA